MPTVTSITRRRGAIAIQLAGEACEHLLAREPVEARALSEGVALEESEWAELRATGRRRLALERALASLSHRSHTEHELRRRLRRQFVDEEIDTAIDRLRELGYLDDARWASEFARSAPRTARCPALASGPRAPRRRPRTRGGSHGQPRRSSGGDGHGSAPCPHPAPPRARPPAATAVRLPPAPWLQPRRDTARDRGGADGRH